MSLTANLLEKRISALEHSRSVRANQHVSIDGNVIRVHGADQTIYVPNGTGLLAHQDNSFVRGIMGPFGSGKTTWAISEIVKRSCESPRWFGGRRKVRWAIVRNTSGELQTTTLQTWLAWYGDLGDIHKRQKPVMTYEHLFNDGTGWVELEIIFLALDRPDDVRKIKSLELTGCYFNEMSEISQAAFSHMKGRINRFPSRAFCQEPYWSGIIFDTNPPDDDHWIHRDFEDNKYQGYKLFKQPPGLLKDHEGHWLRNPDADNAANLPDDYYLKLAAGQTQEFIKVYCLGQYGSVGTGKLVFSEFNPDIHAAVGLQAIQGKGLILGWDFGLTPACIVMQLTPRGMLMVLKEYVSDGLGIRTFAESVVIPGLSLHFPYCKVERSIADPAGMSRNEIFEEMSCIGELNSLGIKTEAASTNDIDPRLGAVRFFLNRMVDGKPAFIMDKDNCPVLYKGFVKHYVYKRLAVSGEERYRDVPEKNHASHPMDALGYGAMILAPQQIMKEKEPAKPIDMWNPVMRSF